MSNYHTNTLAELSVKLQTGEVTSVQLTEYFLARINKHNDDLNCFITVTDEAALAEAKAADEKRNAGNAGP